MFRHLTNHIIKRFKKNVISFKKNRAGVIEIDVEFNPIFTAAYDVGCKKVTVRGDESMFFRKTRGGISVYTNHVDYSSYYIALRTL